MRISDWSSDVCSSDLRILSRSDSSLTTLFYSGTAGAVVMTLLLPTLDWRWPGIAGWATMAFLGLAGGLGHFMLIRAFTTAPASSQIGRASCRERVCPYG